jgi:predicted permease
MLQDVRLAVRRLRRSPGFALAAALTLAVAVGANTAILSIADSILFRPLPFADPERVFLLQMRDPQTDQRYTMIQRRYVDAIRREHSGLGDVGTFQQGSALTMPGADGALLVRTLPTSASYFEVLGVRPLRGRLFAPTDSPSRAALLMHRFWRAQFNGDPAVVGRTIHVGTSAFDVVGVLPADFVFPTSRTFSGAPDIVTLMAPLTGTEGGGTFHPVVRLEPGVTRERAQAELDAIAARLTAGDTRSRAVPFLEDVRTVMYPVGRPIMRFLLAAAMLVLLIGGANLANMLLARSRARERDTAMRTALGASRARVVRPLVIEALLIGVAASVIAVAVTWTAFDVLLRQVPAAALGNAIVGVDVRVALIALGLGLAGGFVFAVVPAWRSARLDVLALLQGRHRHGGARARLGRPMVTVQVALAVVLVFGAGVATRAFVDVLSVPLGYEPERVLQVGIPVPRGVNSADFTRRVLDAVSRHPDIVAAGAGTGLMTSGEAPWTGVLRPGTTDGAAGMYQTLPGYFEALQIPVVRGRTFTWDDGPQGAVVSESAARELFGSADPLGQTITDGRDTWRVTGVVADVRTSLRADDSQPVAYGMPAGRAGVLRVFARTRAQSEATRVALRRDLVAAFPGSVVNVTWWSDAFADLTVYKNPRFQTTVLTAFATIALGLTALGIFGVVSFLVAARTREMGIRLAIGAEPSRLTRLMVAQTLLPVAIGLALGLGATRWAAQLVEAQLFAIDTADPVTRTLAALVVLVAATLAAWLPARRAAKVNPVTVLRAE